MAQRSIQKPVKVLKFGSSVLRGHADLALAVHDIHRFVREGHAVVAVASALSGRTDALLAQATADNPDASPEAVAALVSIGEQESAALLALALDRAGLRTTVLPPNGLGIRVSEPSLDAHVVAISAAPVLAALERAEVVVVPGFVGADDSGRTALLGRGGSDLTAVLLADALDAECDLVKDVDGLLDPQDRTRRFATITYGDAFELDAKALQTKALASARARGRDICVRQALAHSGTSVGGGETVLVRRTRPRRVRVALLGLGTVGRGAYERLRALADYFELVGVAVRDVDRHAASGVPRSLLSSDAAALAREAELVIELIGGVDPAACIAGESLRAGKQFVTANKSLVARHGPVLEALAASSGGALRSSAAVGGAAPCIEFVERVASQQRVVRIEGVVNGTTNVILDQLRTGAPFDQALALAQARGYAEADPSADIDGIDAAEKLRILCRIAFAREPDALTVEGIRAVDARNGCVRLVARAVLVDDRVAASVRPERLSPLHPLADVRGSWNRLIVTSDDGQTRIANGRGAGRWPTTESVIADALDAHRALNPANVREIAKVVA